MLFGVQSFSVFRFILKVLRRLEEVEVLHRSSSTWSSWSCSLCAHHGRAAPLWSYRAQHKCVLQTLRRRTMWRSGVPILLVAATKSRQINQEPEWVFFSAIILSWTGTLSKIFSVFMIFILIINEFLYFLQYGGILLRTSGNVWTVRLIDEWLDCHDWILMTVTNWGPKEKVTVPELLHVLLHDCSWCLCCTFQLKYSV